MTGKSPGRSFRNKTSNMKSHGAHLIHVKSIKLKYEYEALLSQGTPRRSRARRYAFKLFSENIHGFIRQ